MEMNASPSGSNNSTMSDVPSAEWMEKYNKFNHFRDQAFTEIDSGLRLEQQGHEREAVKLYEAGLLSIDKALEIYIESIHCDLWDSYYANVQKMKGTKKEILSRLTDLQNNTAGQDQRPTGRSDVPNAPPSYDEAMSSSSTPSSPYTTLSDSLLEMHQQQEASQATLLYLQDNVRMYYISPDGNVGSPSIPVPLSIVQYEERDVSKPKHYLNIGNWIYPLVPGISPILHSEFGAFIFPDVHSNIEGSCIGLILPDDADSSVYEILDDIIQGIIQQQKAPPPRPPPPYITVPSTSPIEATETSQEPMSRKISHGIVIGAQYLSYGLVKGAEKASEFLYTNTPKVIAKISAEPEPRPIPPNVKKGMKVARNVTGTAVQVTGFVAGKIGSATMALGRMLAPHVQTHGTRLLSSMASISQEEAASKVGGALEVTAGAVEGAGTVYSALEKSAGILAESLAKNTVNIVQHKYGQNAGEVTDDTLHTVGYAVLAGHNAHALTAKGIAKRAAKNAGKAVLEDYTPKKSDLNNGDSATSSKSTLENKTDGSSCPQNSAEATSTKSTENDETASSSNRTEKYEKL